MSVTQCSVAVSYEAERTPVSFRLSQSTGSRKVAAAAQTSGRWSRRNCRCANGSRPDSDGAPPVSADPAREPLRRVALDAHAAGAGARDAPRLLGAAAVEPGERRRQRLAGGVDRDRPGPLPGDRDGGDARELVRVLRGEAPRARDDRAPPVLRPLLRGAVGAEQHLDRLERRGQDGAVQIDQRDLRPARPEVDREHVRHVRRLR